MTATAATRFACFGATLLGAGGAATGAARRRRAARGGGCSTGTTASRGSTPASELSRFNADPRDDGAGERRRCARLAAGGRDRRRAERRPGRRDAARRHRGAPATAGDLPRAAPARRWPCGWRRLAGPPRRPRRRLARARRRRRVGARQPAARCRARRRRARQGPVRRPARRGRSRVTASFAVDCAGDLRVGGCAAARCTSPARSTDGRCTRSSSPTRAWPPAGSAGAAGSTSRGRPAHHLLDPATGAARVHRRRPGHRDRAHRARGRDRARRPPSSSGPERGAPAGCRTAAWSCSTTARTRFTEGCALPHQAGHLPGKSRVREVDPEAVLGEHLEHRGRRVRERAELAAAEPEARGSARRRTRARPRCAAGG